MSILGVWHVLACWLFHRVLLNWPNAYAGSRIPHSFPQDQPLTPISRSANERLLTPTASQAGIIPKRGLLLTPGIYELSTPIVIMNPGFVVLGLGFPTLVAMAAASSSELFGSSDSPGFEWSIWG